MRMLTMVVSLLWSLAAAAQAFPAKPVTLLVTFPAGGPTDIAGRALAVFTEKRTAVWPDVPTLAELGYGIVSTSPYGIGVPAATPPAVVKILHDAFRKGLEDPIHTKTLEKYNQPVWYLSSEDYTKWAREQFERERRLIERLGLAKKK